MKANYPLAKFCLLVAAAQLGFSQCQSNSNTSTAQTSVTSPVDSIPPTAESQVNKADTGKLTALTDTLPAQAPLTLIVNNLSSDTAPIVVGVYGAKNKFPDPNDQLKEYHFKPHGRRLTAKINDLKFDTYALAIYQDVNSNGKIDKNLIGVPTEPYAFSNNFKPTVKAPGFNNCKFAYDSNANTVTMDMIR